jgi:hypothetical protein
MRQQLAGQEGGRGFTGRQVGAQGSTQDGGGVGGLVQDGDDQAGKAVITIEGGLVLVGVAGEAVPAYARLPGAKVLIGTGR